MTPQEISALLSAAQTIATVLSGLGVPGLLALGLAGPVVVLATVLVLDFMRHVRMEKMQQDFRRDAQATLEAYRADMAAFHAAAGEKHAAVSRYYENNVTLVKSYEQYVEALQTLVVNNTRSVERLVIIIETLRKQ